MVVFNTSQWSGDYLEAGVGAISLLAANPGPTPLLLRVALGAGIQGGLPASSGTWWSSAEPFPLASGADWTEIRFALAEPALVRVLGEDSLESVLGAVQHLRILSSDDPSTRGDFMIASLALDDIRAASAAEPSPLAALLLLVLARVAVGVRRRWLAD